MNRPTSRNSNCAPTNFQWPNRSLEFSSTCTCWTSTPRSRFERGFWPDHNSSVFLNGKPRSPLKSLRRRLSLELDGRRMISGATRSPVSRRARRPFSQSSHRIGSLIGIVGTPDLESFGFDIDGFFNVVPVFISVTLRQPPNFGPVGFHFISERGRQQFLSTFARRRIVL